MQLTVACVWVNGHVPFTIDYVTKLRAMVTRHLARPFRFVCLTDRPNKVPEIIDTITIPNPNPLPGWWSKVNLFDDALGLTGRVLYLDLDTLIVGALDAIVDYPAPFALVPHEGRFEGINGRAVVKRFNSSVMVWDGGTLGRLFADWTPDVTARLHGDQDWIGEQIEKASAMPLWWFPRLSSIGASGKVPPDAKVILAKTPKNTEAAKRWPWFRDVWKAA